MDGVSVLSKMVSPRAKVRAQNPRDGVSAPLLGLVLGRPALGEGAG